MAAALFDVDGTLLDTCYLHTMAWEEAFVQFEHTPPMARIHEAIGISGAQFFDHVLGEDRDRGQDDDISAAHQALYARFWPRLRAFDGAADLLRELAARGWQVLLASSASARDLKVTRRVLGADDVIKAATSADDVAKSKPAPDMVQATLDLARTPPEQALFVGDTIWDVKAAAAAGVACVAVLSGGHSAHDLLAGGAIEVHDDVGALLRGLDDSVLGRTP
jgi:HAD superfamily hydrolase (TIGR01509 family)